ncbi:MAG: response regulator transcription factor [Chlorobiaceae bacterium]|nr:response regulator transcription factor [Chlorobiaceae bacterium]
MRLLIITDEPDVSGFIKNGLEKESFSVDIACDGRSGLDFATTRKYDLLIIDWMSPVVSGIEVCRQVRKSGSEVPILFLTARDNLEDMLFGMDARANDYIRKPLVFEELLVRIRVQLRNNSRCDESPLRTGKLNINPVPHQVFCNVNEITLTPKEFALLEYLVRNKGRVCTRSCIMKHVWDIHFESDTSVIDVYITFLRKKLENAGCGNMIQTIRGVGYIVRESEMA